MKQKLLLIILLVLFFTAALRAQNHVWDLGNDTANWPTTAGFDVTTTIDGLTVVPGGSTTGTIEAKSVTWFSGTANEYTSTNRFKLNGSSGIDPSGGVDFMPTKRYVTFPVSGPVSVKIWFRPSGTSLPRALWVTDGSAEVTHYDGLGDTDPNYIEANYNGGAGNLYIFGANNSFNLFKIEISNTLLGNNEIKSQVSTSMKAISNRIYVSNVKTNTEVNIYSITGALVKSFKTKADTDFYFRTGLWIAIVKTNEGQKSFKLLTH